jgi:hypothetical protein
MKDARLIELKLRAERDRKLSDGAARLLALIVSELYVDRGFRPEDEFPLPWSLVARWTGICRRQAWERLQELCKKGYLRFSGLSGCPATNRFVLVLKGL